MVLGAHVSAAGGLYKAIHNGEKLDCQAIQIFLKSPHQWAGKIPASEDIIRLRETAAGSSVKSVLVHDIHLTNLASPNAGVLAKSQEQFRIQMDLAEACGITYIVTHLGSHLGEGEAVGLKTLSDSLNQLFGETSGGEVKVLLETTAGQGSNLGYCFEHLRRIIDDSKFPERLGVCFDTCHVFAAGYDLRTVDDYHQTFDQFDAIIGLERLQAFHLNDAKSEYNSRVDRHDHIGEGNIGITAFELLVNDSRFANVPMVIETPKMETMHAKNLSVLKGLVQ